MAGSPGTRPPPDPPEGPRAALVIATASYQDPAPSPTAARVALIWIWSGGWPGPAAAVRC